SMSIQLAPKPGFCVKSSVIQPAAFSIRTQPVQVPAGLKVFVNVAWDKNVPSPPEGSEEDIRRAMQGQDVNEPNVHGWFVPVVVSEGRQDVDKAGKPALVFDCVYNSSIKTRSLADVEFKSFLVELALQRIEAQTGLALSRQIGTPNIASKGKLTPRTVHVPTRLFEPSSSSAKMGTAQAQGSAQSAVVENSSSSNSPLIWRWAKEGDKLRVTVAVPRLTRDLIEAATLDIEARRLILCVPGRPMLDINLDLSDAEIVARASLSAAAQQQPDSSKVSGTTLTLKRQRDFDVDGARAEWRVADPVLVVFV
ncbi:hypothetical protein AMATHDRAFT_96732, partial [Amanita thiersii Skay4041]